ncbi:MAG: dihydropteroate synthase [Planctomycetes bacterium]|nr:dihydropteroate synthase [Planctomycetota bacterium]
MRIFGIVNVTKDSFSDGGRWLAPDAAIARSLELAAAGADVIDLGAESTHPDAEPVPADEEIRRLRPVVEALRRAGCVVSVDTCKPDVMAAMLACGVDWLNDVRGFRSPAAMAVVASAPVNVRFVAMCARSDGPRADRADHDPATVVADVRAFFAERAAAFAAVGIGRDRLVLDPGMGFFLGRDPANSLRVLRHLEELGRDCGPLLVSVSRKSFLGAVTGADVKGRGAATLAAELWAARAGAMWIRTHDVGALRDALLVERAIAKQP